MANIDQDGSIFVGKSSKPEVLTLALANRHGLVTGATVVGAIVDGAVAGPYGDVVPPDVVGRVVVV